MGLIFFFLDLEFAIFCKMCQINTDKTKLIIHDFLKMEQLVSVEWLDD